MEWLEITKIIIAIITAVITVGIPAFIKLRKAILARRNAETEADKAKAESDLLMIAKQFIKDAEIIFAGFDKVMKAQGSSAGAMKKESVLTKLQSYALNNGYDFDVEYWGNEIDELVKFTREVNTQVTSAVTPTTPVAANPVSPSPSANAANPVSTIRRY